MSLSCFKLLQTPSYPQDQNHAFLLLYRVLWDLPTCLPCLGPILPIHSVLQTQQNTYNATMFSPICMCCFITSPNLQWLPLPCSVWLSHLSKFSIKIPPLKHLQGVCLPLGTLSAFSSMLPKVLITFIKNICWKVLSSLLLELSHNQCPGRRI